MNLPDKIKPTFRRITDKVIIAADLSPEAKAINQLIDYLKEREENEYLPQYNLGTDTPKMVARLKMAVMPEELWNERRNR